MEKSRQQLISRPWEALCSSELWIVRQEQFGISCRVPKEMESATQIRLATFQKARAPALFITFFDGQVLWQLCLSYCTLWLQQRCAFYRLQDVEYNSQTFTKLESDLVRGNSDLKSFEKEIKDRKFRSNLRSQRTSVNHAAVENFHLRTLAGFDKVFGRTWCFMLRPVLSVAGVLVCWHWWDWAVRFGIQSSPTLVRSKVWVSKSASKSESSNWNLCKRPFKCNKSEAKSSKMLQVVLWVFLDGFFLMAQALRSLNQKDWGSAETVKAKMSFHIHMRRLAMKLPLTTLPALIRCKYSNTICSTQQF